ncbi:hypothetical protein D3C71_1946950 [compost metagenome]
MVADEYNGNFCGFRGFDRSFYTVHDNVLAECVRLGISLLLLRQQCAVFGMD